MLGALAAVPYFYRKLDDTVRGRVEAIFAERYHDLQVTVKSAALVQGGIQIRGVSIVDPEADGPGAELAYFEELFLACETDLSTFLGETPQIDEIVARRPTIRATRRPDGSWSAARLFPLPKLGSSSPSISIEAGMLELFDPLKNPTSTLVVRDGYFKIARRAESDSAPANALLGVTGSCTADGIRRIAIEDGSFDPGGGTWELHGNVEGLDVGPELVHCLSGLAERVSLLESLRAQAEGRFTVRYDAAVEPHWDYHVEAQLARGRLDDPRLPHPWTDLRADVQLGTGGFAIHNLTATSEAATLRLDLERHGYGENAPMAFAAEARQLKLDRRLAEILPARWQESWKQFLPDGEIDLDARASFDGATWAPEVTVTCHDVAFTYHKFPYRLEHGAGRVTLKDNVLALGLKAYSDVEEVRLDGEIHRPGPDWTGFFQIRANKLRADQKLTAALPAKPREIVTSLNAHGTFNLFVRYWRDAGAPLHNYLSIYLNRCDIRFDRFPYPLQNVKGTVELTDGHWNFDGLEGANDTGRVTCHGRMTPGPDGNVLALKFHGTSVPLEEELRDALRPSARQLWNDLRPAGAVNLDVDVLHQTNWRDPQIHVIAEPVENSVAVEPSYFPYRLDNVRGIFEYENGHVDLRGLRAEHGTDTRLSARGHCEVDASGGWRLQLRDMSVGRLTVDRDLVQALPARLKKAATELRLTGPLSFRGAFDLASTGKPGEPLSANWDVTADLQQVRMEYALPLDNINGGIRLSGRSDGRQFWSRGALDLDSMTYKNFQLTEVRGPLWIDDRRVLLGANVQPPPGERERPITARACGGIVQADAWAMLGAAPQFNLDATITQAQLGRCAQELIDGRQKLSGELSARVNIHGQGTGTNQLGGWGGVQLRNADVYQLPIMVSLLKILSIRVPDTVAFSKSDIDFRLEGEHIYFNRIDFNGDAISLRGTGEMGLDRILHLTFYTVVGRDEFRVPIVSDVLGGASQQLMAIYVEGPLARPTVRKQPLPAVSEALQQLQAELQQMGAGAAASSTGARPRPRPALQQR